MNPLWYLLVCVLAVVVTAAITPFAIKFAKRFDIIDYPDGRRINERPVPRPGGIALFFGIFVPLGIFFILFGMKNGTTPFGLSPNINYYGVLLASFVMFAVGLADDMFTLRVRYKLLGQITAAAIACFSGVLLSQVAAPFGGPFIELGYFAYPITIFYLVAFANIINLIDGLDGLAAGVVAISAVALFIIALRKGGLDAALLAVIIVGACLAFLRFNYYPARIFMGDSGALLLGFLLGLISLFGFVRTPALITLAIPVVVAGIPVIDTLSAIIRRIRSGKSVVDADTAHIHHRFLAIGYDHQTTVYIIYVLSGLLAVCALLMTQYSGWIRWAILGVLLLMVALLILRLRLISPVLKHHYHKRSPSTAATAETINKADSGEESSGASDATSTRSAATSATSAATTAAAGAATAPSTPRAQDITSAQDE